MAEDNENQYKDFYYFIREEYILSLGNKIIRYNPNQKDFDLSNVLREINKLLFSKGV